MLVAAAFTTLYRSTDFGVSWSAVPNLYVEEWKAVRCNDDASICLAAALWDPNYDPGRIYRSVDGGDTWSAVPNTQVAPAGNWYSLWCDASGSKWYALLRQSTISNNGWVYKSVDGGATFTQVPGTQLERWTAIGCDATGTKCFLGCGQRDQSQAGPYGLYGPLYVTTNGFQTLQVVPNFPYSHVFNGIEVSADGSQVVVAQYEIPGLVHAFIYHSEDGGQTFQKTNAPQRLYVGVTCDAAFRMCAAAPNGDQSYMPTLMLTSCDGGKTWSEDPTTKATWTATKVAKDGGMMWATVDFPNPRQVYSYPLPTA